MSRFNHLDAQTRITSVAQVATITPTRDAYLLQVRGPDIGRRLLLTDRAVTIGRDPESTIALRGDSVSRYHARIEPSGQGGHQLIDNQSTNGTYRNQVQVNGGVQLVSGDYIAVGDAIFKYLSGGNIEVAYHEEIYRLTIEDSLTQVANKRALLDFLDREFARAKRYHRELGVIMMDVDHFKRVNDTYGHLMGDFVLREVARVVSSRVRKEEMFARYGGEEFCVVLPEMDMEHATKFAETIRVLVEEHPFSFEGNVLRLTCSLGVAQMSEAMTRPEELVLEADENLYRAKGEGRNRVVSS
jgi:diguanylate cyclase (GGDEF)-like protein